MTACRNCAAEIVCEHAAGYDSPVWLHVAAGGERRRLCARAAPLQNAPDTRMPYYAEPSSLDGERTVAGCWAETSARACGGPVEW